MFVAILIPTYATIKYTQALTSANFTECHAKFIASRVCAISSTGDP